jgi:hypothetical protein
MASHTETVLATQDIAKYNSIISLKRKAEHTLESNRLASDELESEHQNMWVIDKKPANIVNQQNYTIKCSDNKYITINQHTYTLIEEMICERESRSGDIHYNVNFASDVYSHIIDFFNNNMNPTYLKNIKQKILEQLYTINFNCTNHAADQQNFTTQTCQNLEVCCGSVIDLTPNNIVKMLQFTIGKKNNLHLGDSNKRRFKANVRFVENCVDKIYHDCVLYLIKNYQTNDDMIVECANIKSTKLEKLVEYIKDNNLDGDNFILALTAAQFEIQAKTLIEQYKKTMRMIEPSKITSLPHNLDILPNLLIKKFKEFKESK